MQSTHYFSNTSGLNLSDSPFIVKDGQATGGWNFEYTKTGAISKSRDRAKINTAADTQTNALGLGVLNSITGIKTVIRAAGTKLQIFNPDTPSFTNLSEDTLASNSTFLTSGSTQPVMFSNFNTSTANTLWMSGGDMANLYGYSTPTAYPSTLTLQGCTYTAVATGTSQVTVAYTPGATAGLEVVTVTGNAVSVQIATGTSTVTQVVAAVNAKPAARLLLSASGNSAAVCTTVAAAALTQPTRPSAVTQNGVAAPVGTVTSSVGGSAGSWTATGTYFYALTLRKATTQALSNASMDVSAAVDASNKSVTLTIPAVDTTKYDAWYLYRSAVGGVTAFTTGTLVAKFSSGTTSYVDDGTTFLATAQTVPRAGSTVTDNSPLPTGTIKYCTTFKRRLVVAIDSTLYFSDLDKPESWPINNYIPIPTGGQITAVSSLGFNAPITGNTDEYLCAWKERELWAVTGNNLSTWTLFFVDAVGCPGQSLVVKANGYVAWPDYRGVHLWDGSGKPVYCSRPIEALFGLDGDLDDTNMYRGWGTFYRDQNCIVWYLSHRTRGVNKYILRLDLRLTLPQFSQNLTERQVDGVFTQGYTASSTLSGMVYLPTSKQEQMLIADDSGYVYRMYSDTKANGLGIDFQYTTKFLDMGDPSQAKQFLKVIVWVDKLANADLTLQYWANYRQNTDDLSQVSEHMIPAPGTSGIYDAAYWNQANWDDYSSERQPIVFNINGSENNGQGDCIRFNVLQQDSNVPVTLYGFTVIWDVIGMRK